MAEIFSTVAQGFEAVAGLTGIDLATREALNNASPGLGDVYDNVRDLMEKRTVISQTTRWVVQNDRSDDREPVVSPIVAAIIDLYAHEPPAAGGVVYVLYAPPGQGKTFGARAILEFFHGFESAGCSDQEADESVPDGKHLKGFMLTGSDLDDDYMASLAQNIGSRNVPGWVNALLLALDEPEGDPASLLILDGFNSTGNDGVNLKFIKRLYGLMDERKQTGTQNTVVLVTTHNQDVANKLCELNCGQRVAPLQNSYTGEAASPVWNDMKWSRDKLIEAIRYKYPGKFEADEKFDNILQGMTPLRAVKIADQMLRPAMKLSSPKRKARKQEG